VTDRDTNTTLPADQLAAFLSRHELPEGYLETARDFFLPIAKRLPELRPGGDVPLMLGIGGAQGTGKSTLADFLGLAVESLHDWRSAVLSLDDFYLTRAERERLAADVHPLLATRGVPGTHDVGLLAHTLDALAAMAPGQQYRPPRFDKSVDDRDPESDFPRITGPLDMVILEGWCVGSSAETAQALSTPVNDLERLGDPDGTWRRYVNTRLETDYEPVFSRLHALVYLAAPGVDAIVEWRSMQERKLRRRAGSRGSRVMSDGDVVRFFRHFERITRNDLETLPHRADIVLTLDERHAVTGCRFRDERWPR